MCRYVERKDFVLHKKIAEERILQTYDLFDLKRPSKIVWCKDIFSKKFLDSAMSAWPASPAWSARSASSAKSASSARSAWSTWSAAWTGLDYEFDWFVFEYEYCKNPTDNKPNENDEKYLQYSELLLEALEAGCGYRVEWEDTLYLVPTPIVRLNDDTPPTYHSDQLPAIKWKNGVEFYYLDGVNFEKELWEKVVSQKMTFKEIIAIDISDQRTVALKYNPQAILNEGATLVHKDNRTNELYLIEGKEINKELEENKIWFLKMTCPTGRVFIEGVPPDEAEKNPNASAMQALLCGLTMDEYMSMVLES